MNRKYKCEPKDRPMLGGISCGRRRWANATKEDCVDELKTCLSSGAKPSKYCEMRIVELLGGHYEERRDQRRKCQSCAWMPKESEAAK